MHVKKQFTEMGLVPQEWGGDLEFIEVSAKSGDGIEKLLETLIAMADIMELKADPALPGQGVVIESRIEQGKGPMASVLVQNGTINVGDFIQAGITYGRVKFMEDEKGKRLKTAEPSRAARIAGLKEVPSISELVQVFATEQEAREEATRFAKFSTAKKVSNVKKIGIEALSAQFANQDKNELGIVVKADVLGSLEAIKENLEKLSNKYVGVKCVGEGVGQISESDVQMAAVSDKIIIGFKSQIASGVEAVAKSKGVKILRYDVIYELIGDIQKILEDMLPTEKIEISVGKLKVLAVFKNSPQKSVVGGHVEEGRAEKNVEARVMRGGESVANYHITTVHVGADEASSCPAGAECGVGVASKVDIKEGDVLEFYRTEERKVTV
jgi:translation initiation factor IF-2